MICIFILCHVNNLILAFLYAFLMFTGIVEGTGKVEKISKNTKNRSAIQMTVNPAENMQRV